MTLLYGIKVQSEMIPESVRGRKSGHRGSLRTVRGFRNRLRGVKLLLVKVRLFRYKTFDKLTFEVIPLKKVKLHTSSQNKYKQLISEYNGSCLMWSLWEREKLIIVTKR